MEETKEIQNNELVQVIRLNSLEPATEEAIRNSFMPFFLQTQEWKEKVMALVVKDINEVEKMQQAREARLILRNIRTDADKKRKELKEDSLNYGRAVQGVYNFIESIVKPMETHLQEQEDFVLIQEENIRKELRITRSEELTPYAEFVPIGLDLGNMTEEDYKKMLNGARLQQKDKIETEAREKAEQKKREEKEAEDREAQKKENERLKKEAEAKAEIRKKRSEEMRPYIIFIRDYNALLEMEEKEYTTALAEIIVGAKQHWEYEAEEARKKTEREQKERDQNEKLRKEKEAQLQKERLAREKAEKELNDKKAADAKALADKAELEELELNKGDLEKFISLMDDLVKFKERYTFKSKKYKKIQTDINTLIDKIIIHVTPQKK